jgi:hypothetical protein
VLKEIQCIYTYKTWRFYDFLLPHLCLLRRPRYSCIFRPEGEIVKTLVTVGCGSDGPDFGFYMCTRATYHFDHSIRRFFGIHSCESRVSQYIFSFLFCLNQEKNVNFPPFFFSKQKRNPRKPCAVVSTPCG